MDDAVTTWEVVTAIATCIGGLGAAIGAGLSWRSATASHAASRDALEALAVGIRPRLGSSFPVATDPSGTRLMAWIDNPSEWPATDLAFEMRFRNGRLVRDRMEWLSPESRGGGTWQIDLGDPPPAGQPVEKVADFAVLRYSDSRGIARYEDRTTFRYEESTEGTLTRTAHGVEVKEERIK